MFDWFPVLCKARGQSLNTCLPARSWDGTLRIDHNLIDGKVEARPTSYSSTWNQHWSLLIGSTLPANAKLPCMVYHEFTFFIGLVYVEFIEEENEECFSKDSENQLQHCGWWRLEKHIYVIANAGGGARAGKMRRRMNREKRRASRSPPAGGRGPQSGPTQGSHKRFNS